MRLSHEGGNAYEHSLDHAVEFFSKAGSLFEKSKSFYDMEESCLSLFQKTWIVDKPLSMKLLFWLRDCRGGAGNRSGFRTCIQWLAKNEPDWVFKNMKQIPDLGRWDDLRCLMDKSISEHVRHRAAILWAQALAEGNVLAAKWADRKDVAIRHQLGMNSEIRSNDHNKLRFREEKKFRKFLANLRSQHIVEDKMSKKNYSEIEYHTVPSVAMSRYTKAFNRNDETRFTEYKESLKKGETKINAEVLFPHDCVRTALYGDSTIANAQFDALPNYLEGVNERIIVLSDTSGSMSITVSGSIQAVHISQGLALYCSEKIGKHNPFYKKFIGFCSESEFKFWEGMTFSEAISNRNIFDGAVGGTRIDKALTLILNTAKMFNLSNDQMPTALLIVSDMQFHQGTSIHWNQGDNIDQTSEVQKALKLWEDAGYSIPKIIYWNTAGYAGQPDTAYGNNVALVSGFSPAILKAIFSGTDLSPRGVMIRALEKYEIVEPK